MEEDFELIEHSTPEVGTLDILLWVSDDSKRRRIVEWASGESWTHVGMIIQGKHINELHSSFNTNLHHLKDDEFYIWESGRSHRIDSEDNKAKMGVSISPLGNRMNESAKCSLRRSKVKITNELLKKIEEIHSIVHDKGYDYNPLHFLEVWMGRAISEYHGRYTDTMFCSAFIAFIYTQLGLIDENTQWTTLGPAYFATDEKLNSLLGPLQNVKDPIDFWSLPMW